MMAIYLCVHVLVFLSVAYCSTNVLEMEQTEKDVSVKDKRFDGLQLVSSALNLNDTVTGSCHCSAGKCGCCQTISIHRFHIHIKNDICINVEYIKSTTIILLTVTWGGHVVYSKEISAHNPPPFCFHIPYLKQLTSACIELYNLKYAKGVSGCARVTLRLILIKPVKLDIGCFHIPLDENEAVGRSMEESLQTADRLQLYEHKRKYTRMLKIKRLYM